MKRRIRVFLLLFISVFCSVFSFSLADNGSILVLPSHTEHIEEEAFMNNGTILSIDLPEGLKTIGARAFSGCSSLRSVRIPDGLESIGEQAFSGADGPLLLCSAKGSPVTAYALNEEIDFQADTRYRALLIGQSTYQTMSHLEGPASDLQMMAQMLRGFNTTPYEVISRNDLTGSEILREVTTAFANAGDEDVSLFYYSGHGGESTDPSMNGALMGIDGEAVTTAQLKNCLDQIPGRKIIILDACFSGQHISRGTDNRALLFNQAVIRAFSNAGAKGRGTTSSLAVSRYYVLTAAHSTQTSMEYTLQGVTFGVFTYSLCKGCGYDLLNGGRGTIPADKDSDGVVTLREAYQYAVVTANGFNSGQTAQVWPEGCSSFGLFRQ